MLLSSEAKYTFSRDQFAEQGTPAPSLAKEQRWPIPRGIVATLKFNINIASNQSMPKTYTFSKIYLQ